MNSTTSQVAEIIKSSRLICHKLAGDLAYELTEAEVKCVWNFEVFLEAGLLDNCRYYHEAEITLFEAALLMGYMDGRKEEPATGLGQNEPGFGFDGIS